MRGAEPTPAHEAAVLMGLGDMVGRDVQGGLGSVSQDRGTVRAPMRRITAASEPPQRESGAIW